MLAREEILADYCDNIMHVDHTSYEAGSQC